MYLLIVIAFLVGLILLFRWRVSEFKGEEAFDVYLEKLKASGYLFEEVLLDNQTMVRYLFVSCQGVFNIFYNPEVLGRIYGDDEESTWKMVMEHRKLPIPNPVRLMEKQRREFEKLGESLNCDLPLYEVVCLSKRANSKLTISVPIVNLEGLVEWVESKERVLTDEEVNGVVKYFETLDA